MYCFVVGSSWVVSFFRVFGRIAIRPYSRVPNVCGISTTTGCRTHAKSPLQQGAERVRNIPYREGAQCVKMPLHIPLKALWGQNRDGGDEVQLGLQPLRGC